MPGEEQTAAVSSAAASGVFVIGRDHSESHLHFASNLGGGRFACYTGRVATALPGRRPRRSRCPIACTLDVLGDRWTLLVVRDLVRGKRRFADFLDSSERIPTNILADRLKRLQSAGIVAARRYSDHPPRMEYVLTQKGEDLRPLVREMVAWGVRHAGGRMPPPVASVPKG